MTWSISSCQALIARAIRLRMDGRNEAVLRGEFQSWLRRVFPDIEDQAWVNHYSEGAEAHARVEVGGRLAHRFVDTLVRSTVIEYEADLRLPARFDHGREQVREYVSGAVRDGTPVTRIRGILSDTVEWHVFDAATRPGVAPANCAAEDVELTEVEVFTAVRADMAEAERYCVFLRKHLAREASRALNAKNIANDLGLESMPFRGHVEALVGLVERARHADTSVTLATDLWSRFVDGLERHEGSFRTEAYVDEMYITVLARLMAASVLDDPVLSSDDAGLQAILGGDHFVTRHRLQNVVEDDYFGWLLRPQYLAQLLPVARDMQRDLAAYDFSRLTEDDLFGRLMSQLARRSQRKLLGQEWTHAWLAEELVSRCLDRVPNGEPPQIVDMCCGSGSIIAAVLKEVRHRDAEITLDGLIRASTGFDIDPLAVMLAKTTWVVTLAQQLQGVGQDVVIPIYHADSLFATTPVSRRIPQPGEAGDIVVELDGQQVVLPQELIAPGLRGLFDAIVDWAYDEAQAAVALHTNAVTRERSETLLDGLIRTLQADVELDLRRRIEAATFELARRMSDLALANRNGIWAFVLRNTYRPGLLAGYFNGLVSNPPWLAMSQLAENPYKTQLSARAALYDIAPGGASHLHLELATTFLLHAIDRYLRPEAAVACLLPGTVFNGSHHQKFRDAAYLEGPRPVSFELQEVWEIPAGTFKVRSAVVVGVKRVGSGEVHAVPVGIHAREAGLQKVSFEVRRLVDRTAWVLRGTPAPLGAPADESVPPQGADLMPRPAVCVDVLEQAGTEWRVNTPSRDSTFYYAVKDSKKLRNQTFPGYVSPEFLFRMVQSLNLLPFVCLEPYAPVALPARRREAGAWETLDVAAIRTAGFRQSALRFERINLALDEDRVMRPLFEKIDERNKLSMQVFPAGHHLVLTGAGGGIACASTIPVDGNQDVVIDQTLYWRCIASQEEAWYRVGLLNSEAITEAIRPFNPQGEFGARHLHTLPHRVIPLFDPTNGDHQQVTELTARLSQRVRELVLQDEAIRSPNSSIAARRQRLRTLVRRLDETRALEELCAAILGTTPTV